ncbi:phytanoyl-CoA dioxygenase domain-containing protein 1-like [Branchiostoma lanceolatum]|uniref:phytanoyl-CoA dioxygenase domain-containing protein 1-like n=1 Tax=Branchiostoma lanceolatum TaxID=7740 RepID=UPI003455A210
MTTAEENYAPPCLKKPALPVRCPEVYLNPPAQPRDKKPGQLSKAQVEQFFRDGYVVVDEFFQPEELQPVREAVAERVDHLAETLHRAGKIKDKHEEAGLFQRLTLLDKEFPGAAIVLVKSRRNMPKAFRDLWSHERLLNAVEQLIGPDIAGHQVWNLRTKTPTNEALTVPWHQDNAYLLPECLGTLQPTAWIPLLDATVRNGCMQVLKGGHRKGVTATHTCCAGGTWYVEVSEKEMEKTLGCDMKKDLVTCEVPYGGVLFLNNCVPHRSLENYSDEIRWSLDLRWQDPNKPSGFWGDKDLVLMRTAKDPGYKPRWGEFLNEEAQVEDGKDNSADLEEDLEPSIQGPWMLRWEIVHHNRHTRALKS